MFFLWVLPWLNNSWCSYGSSKMEREMNANELAVYLEDITDWEESPYRQAATMLRQQAQEIAMLKQIIDANNLQSDIGQFKKASEK